jgi:hypothetical protein
MCSESTYALHYKGDLRYSGPMGFAILRTQKLKSAVAVRRSMTHAFREQDTPNADPSRTRDNTHFGAQSMAEGLAAFNATLPDKHRKDAVQCIEYLVTASPDALNAKDRVGQDRYFADALDWLKGRHGDDNVIYAGIHRDETTPHMYAYVVPRDPDTGNLNARRWLGGAKALGQMQTEFAERVGQQHGFRRGIEHSRAQHTTIREFYGALAKPEHRHGRISAEQITPQVIEKKLFSTVTETPETVAERLTTAIQSHYAPALKEAATARLTQRKADEANRTAFTKERELETVQKRLQGFERAFGGLDKSDMQELVQLATLKREERRQETERQRRVDQLADLLKRASGAALTFAQHAVAAIKAKAGQWRLVEWATVETAAVREAVQVNQQSRVSAATAVLDHSPGRVDVSPRVRAATLEKAAADDRAAGLKPAPERPSRGPSLGR